MPSNKIPVYPFGTAALLPGCPPHSASKTLALLALTAYAVKRSACGTALIQLTREPWNQVRKRLRGAPSDLKIVIQALAPADSYHACTMLSYPPAGQESDARRRQAELWTRAERF